MKKLTAAFLSVLLFCSFSISVSAAPVINTTASTAAAAVRFSQKQIRIVKGKRVRLSALATDTAGKATTATYKSSNPSVATVSKAGYVYAKKIGTARITASLRGAKIASLTVRVVEKHIRVTSVSINNAPKTLSVGGTKRISTTYRPATATSAIVKYKSSNRRVATVDASGLIKAIAPGTAKITAIAGARSKTVTVTVKKPIADPKPIVTPDPTPSPSPSPSPDSSSPGSNMVWIPATGTKYHSHSGCSNMKNPSQVTLAEAIARGYGQCSKCW